MLPPERLIWIRTTLRLSKEALARLLGVGVSSVQRWERGDTGPVGPTLQVYRALEAALQRGHTAETLLTEVGGDPGRLLARIFALGFLEDGDATARR